MAPAGVFGDPVPMGVEQVRPGDTSNLKVGGMVANTTSPNFGGPTVQNSAKGLWGNGNRLEIWEKKRGRVSPETKAITALG